MTEQVDARALRGRSDVRMSIEQSFLDRAENGRGGAETMNFTAKAHDAGLEWFQALKDSGEFETANFLDLGERDRMVEWLDEHGHLQRVLGNPRELDPRMHPDSAQHAAHVIFAWFATQLQAQWDDEALRCFEAEAAGIETYHREGTIA